MANDRPSTIRAAHIGLAVLTLINLFNYLDRYVIATLLGSLKADLHFSDAQLGALATSFVIVYMLTSPVFGTWGDRGPRPRLIAFGVAVWSLATALAGMARNFLSLFLARAAVGIGEAAYGTIAPSLLADYYPKQQRGRVFAIFFAAIPIGSALAYYIGGAVNRHFGWRAAFYIVGLPGLLLAAMAVLLRDPPRGAQDREDEQGMDVHVSHRKDVGGWRSYAELLQNRPYVLTILGYAAYTFALGGIVIWMPEFLMRVRGVPSDTATEGIGQVIVITGLVGTSVGGWLGDYFLRYTKQSYLWVSGIATLVAVPFVFITFLIPLPSVYWSAMIIAEILIFASTGPINSAIVNLVEPGKRATAVAACNFVIHLLGDVPSPPIIGFLSDQTSLGKAVLIVPIAVTVASIIWILAAIRARGNQETRGTTRRIFRALFSLILRIFFRRIEVVGREHVPADGPVIFVLNHPNGLIDPLFVLCLAPRPVSFLAKSTLFYMPVIGFVVKAFDSLPVYRRQDAGVDTTHNRETFEHARRLLARGGTLALFPEGASHSDPKLRPLKTGAARIALGTAAALSGGRRKGGEAGPPWPPLTALRIVPAGVYYTAKGTFRSAALLYLGEPITVEPVALEPDGEPPRGPVQQLTARIERALAEVTLQAERQETLDLVARAEHIFSSAGDRDGAAAALAREFEIRRRLLAGYTTGRTRLPERITALAARITRYEAELQEAGLDAHRLSPEGFTFAAVARYALKSLLVFALLLPAALAGTLVHYPAYRLAGLFAMRLSKGEDDLVATIKVLSAMLFFPLTWLLLAAGLAVTWNARVGLAALAAAPLTGYTALIFFEHLDALLGGARALTLFLMRRRAFDRLVRERAAIRAEILKLGEEIGPAPGPAQTPDTP